MLLRWGSPLNTVTAWGNSDPACSTQNGICWTSPGVNGSGGCRTATGGAPSSWGFSPESEGLDATLGETCRLDDTRSRSRQRLRRFEQETVAFLNFESFVNPSYYVAGPPTNRRFAN